MTSLQDKIAALKAGDDDLLLEGTKYANVTKGKWEFKDDGSKQSVIATYLLTDENRGKYHSSYTHGWDIICDNEQYEEMAPSVENMKIVADAKQNAAKVIVLEEQVRVLREAAKNVCWFDWSENDDDAVEAVEELREALAATDMGE